MLPRGNIIVSTVITYNCYNGSIRQFLNFVIFQEMELKISHIVCPTLTIFTGVFWGHCVRSTSVICKNQHQ